MKIVLLGYGKMGKLIEKTALARGHEILDCVRSDRKNSERICEADVCIDFSQADAVMGHLEECARNGKNLVIGTTGWEGRLREAQEWAQRFRIGVLYAPNFSLGVHLFLKILEFGAQVIDRFSEYDVAGIELHHAKKKDAPSGTALEICRRIEKAMNRIGKLDMTAVRLGSIPGTHQVLFDSPYDTISIRHEARNREGFAKGAVDAAEWLIGKQGFYTLDDLIQGICHEI